MSQALIREVMSLTGLKFQNAKKLVKLAAEPVGEIRVIGSGIAKKHVIQHEAEFIVAVAKRRIALVDEGG